ncbi:MULTISPECIES: DUF3558 domain-containing protein [Rhodococcus]|uniref:DUF3558 domain-containing protein n=1 Tax=Rhodococcus TaxID=1827 RepID=UPI00051A75B1|nr:MULTISPECIES: DUF3558 domain-containing protein [Rhodococcus]AOD22422.1 hypothetical protein IM25_13055 [Rhodococcus sp. p52]MXQ77430.1 DUF3558 domain-containing protein [Rhodococcus rhodochrous]QXU54999.1 DUF3558 domain-containing protein [Rhodococcus sp. LW-XY12]
MGRWGIVALAALAVMGTGCSPGSAKPATSDEAATSTTHTPRITDDSGRPPVTFDPCYDIPDDVMNAAGYDASEKKMADMPMGSHTFLGCRYAGTIHIPGALARYGLIILAGNVTLEEELEKNGVVSTTTTINGRRALREVGANGNDECTYVLEADFGIILFNRLYHKDHAGPVPVDEWCAGLDQFVERIEPFVGA